MDGAYNHVRPVEGGQGDGVNLTPWKVSTTLCFQSENTSVILLDILLLHIRSSEHPVSICLWTCSGSLYSNFTHRVLHLRIECLLFSLHHPCVWILYNYYLPQEGDQHLIYPQLYFLLYQKQSQVHDASFGPQKDYKGLEKTMCSHFVLIMANVVWVNLTPTS